MLVIKSTRSDAVANAVAMLTEGQAIVYPTDTIYALGADATREDCAEKVYKMKARDPLMPLSVAVSSFRMLKAYSHMTDEQEVIVKQLFPGKVTVILDGKGLAHGISGDGVGFRIPLNPLAAEIVETFNKPITATSVNPSGQPSATTIEQATLYFGDQVSIYFDAGELTLQPSTVVDLRGEPKIIREGSDHQKVLDIIKKI